jgi:hypothetical protein
VHGEIVVMELNDLLFTLGLTIPGVSSLVEFEYQRRTMLRSRASRSCTAHMQRGVDFALKWRTPAALASGTCFAVGLCTVSRCSPKTKNALGAERLLNRLQRQRLLPGTTELWQGAPALVPAPQSDRPAG